MHQGRSFTWSEAASESFRLYSVCDMPHKEGDMLLRMLRDYPAMGPDDSEIRYKRLTQ